MSYWQLGQRQQANQSYEKALIAAPVFVIPRELPFGEEAWDSMGAEARNLLGHILSPTAVQDVYDAIDHIAAQGLHRSLELMLMDGDPESAQSNLPAAILREKDRYLSLIASRRTADGQAIGGPKTTGWGLKFSGKEYVTVPLRYDGFPPDHGRSQRYSRRSRASFGESSTVYHPRKCGR